MFGSVGPRRSSPEESRIRSPTFFHAHETARADELDGQPLASFPRRAVGFAIDLLIVALLGKPIEYAWQNYVPHGWEQHTRIDLEHVRSLIVLVVYFSIAVYLGHGRTVGKWIANTRVVSLTHQRVTAWQSVERALGYGASFLEVGFGFLQYFINRNRQCVHDRIAETIVVDARSFAPTRQAGAK